MGAYLIRRLLLVVPTLFGIIAINFVVVQFAPGGPVEQMIAELPVDGRLSGGQDLFEGQPPAPRPCHGCQRACQLLHVAHDTLPHDSLPVMRVNRSLAFADGADPPRR